jgi:GH24 family phage-related lysozyme (muramidase)
MLFNMGQTNFNKFLKMKQALDVGDYPEAAKQMLASRWAKQVKGRAVELSKQMETGKWQP